MKEGRERKKRRKSSDCKESNGSKIKGTGPKLKVILDKPTPPIFSSIPLHQSHLQITNAFILMIRWIKLRFLSENRIILDEKRRKRENANSSFLGSPYL